MRLATRYAIVINPDHSITMQPLPNDPGTESLRLLQHTVGGYIERVEIMCNGLVLDMWVNEEGLLKQLPYNEQASRLVAYTDVALHVARDDVKIVGSVVIAAVNDWGDIRGLTSDEIIAVISSVTDGMVTETETWNNAPIRR